MENCEKFFEVNINKYVSGKNFSVWRPASLNNPKNHAVMFITKEFMQYPALAFHLCPLQENTPSRVYPSKALSNTTDSPKNP